MAKVRILPEILSNKIAAGEVVERPGSVVKELLENALDAKSTLIEIEVDNGGKSLIRVSDNGMGMSRDDALLCIERYATSKIYDDKDLFSIRTLGFRGEAIPSIASVSRFSLVTREKDADSGTRIDIEGGNIKKVLDVGAAPGTMITVERLFFNTPARRKFLKSTQTETGHIMDTVASIALGWPQVQFRLSHNKKPVKSWPQAKGFYDRAVDVLGRDLRNSLVDVSFDDGYLTVSGLVSSPDITRTSTQRTFLYINGRHIRDRRLIHALLNAYGSRLMKGRYPVAVLFLTVPFDQLDVNVHPTKHEVRFVDHNRIYTSVQACVSLALNESERRVYAKPFPQPDTERSQGYETAVVNERLTAPSLTQTRFSDRVRQEPGRIREAEAVVFHAKPHGDVDGLSYEPAKETDRFIVRDEFVNGDNELKSDATVTERRFFSDMRIIGQLHNSYVLCEAKEGMIIIDQHAAHERIVYEELKKKAGHVRSQALLIPEIIELGYKESVALETVRKGLAELGLIIEPYGDNTFAVKSVPAILSQGMITKLVIEIAEKQVELGSSSALEQALDDCLVLMSCHGAVRANQSLSETQIRHLLKQMDDCQTPSFCPHGRPTWTQYGIRSIEKAFKR